MRVLFYGLLSALLLLLAAVGISTYRYTSPQDYPETTVVIPPSTGVRDVLGVLHAAGLIPRPALIMIPLLMSGDGFKLKAGEYQFAANLSPKDIFRKMVRGEVVVHKFTMPEGWTLYQLRLLLAVQPLLSGDLPDQIPEGSAFPDTVHFTRGESRAKVLARMQKAMQDTLSKEWQTRDPSTPVNSPEEALVLASIIEKETGLEQERGKIAGVFANRLRIGMPLQSDPTVVYGIMAERGGAPVTRDLTTEDLKRDTVYNTYTRLGLPPAPICSPGREAIHAALHPQATDALYFVATGHGGHAFAATLKEHNANVAQYRAAMRQAAIRNKD